MSYHPLDPLGVRSSAPQPAGGWWHQRAPDGSRDLDLHGSLWGTDYGVEGPSLTLDPQVSDPLSSSSTPVPSRAQAEGGCQPGHSSRSSLSQRGTEGKAVCKMEKDTYHAFTLYSDLGILYVLIALSLYPFPTCTYTVFFSGAYYFYWAIFGQTGRSCSDSLTRTLLPSSLHKTDWIWMRSLVLMSIIFISQDIFFRTLPAINYVVYLFFLLPCYSSVGFFVVSHFLDTSSSMICCCCFLFFLLTIS